ncbi:hypothetical protein EV700_1799 [Fluviicoccus keumensis]|uniref:Uncharacterized protein n=1 Tax=Fluviicoccus keumensis TaxID=1435465 RepID=A0A4Q7Z3P2_9GAMM|nr:hypothetical protein [Fluviicoccus keumensis]RZU44992.1 hypothetical protein EV700_1799 [Fluviicoccus keumensis]
MSTAIAKIDIWDPAVLGQPKSFAKILDTARDHDESEGQPTPLLLEFARQVQAHAVANPDEFPNYLDFVDWVQGRELAILSLEVTYRGDYESMVVFLVETASHLGLVVLLEDWMMAWLPGGQVLPKTKAGDWDELKRLVNTDDPEQPRTLKKFRSLVEPTLLPLLAREGFKLDETRCKPDDMYLIYSREVEGVSEKQSIGLSYGDLRGCFFTRLSVEIFSEKVWSIYQEFDFSKISERVFHANVDAFFASSTEWYKGMSIKEKILEQKRQLEEGILPVVNMAKKIQGLDYLMNAPDTRLGKKLRSFFYLPHCAIVAWLAGNPRFDELVVELDAAKLMGGGANRMPMMQGEFQKLVQYLNDEVEPLV